MMHYRKLGNTGIKISVLGMGSSPFRHGPPEACAELLNQASKLGINYYDTARSYVNGEEVIALLPNEVKQKLVIATKTGGRAGNSCLKDLQLSLTAMQRGWVDIWMEHMIETEEDYELCTGLGGFCDVAEAAKRAGLIRATGASFHAPTHLIERAVWEKAFDIVMFQFNIIGRETLFGSPIASYRDKIIPAAQDNQVGVVVMKTLAAGNLSYGASRLDFITDTAAERDVAGGALRYAAMHPGIATAVVGMSSTEELVANVLAVTGIDDSMLPVFDNWTAKIDKLDQRECSRCGRCTGVCPRQIELPKIFRLYDQLRFFGMDYVSRNDYAKLTVNAAACDGCRRCSEICPQSLDIVKSLKKAHTILSRKNSSAGKALAGTSQGAPK